MPPWSTPDIADAAVRIEQALDVTVLPNPNLTEPWVWEAGSRVVWVRDEAVLASLVAGTLLGDGRPTHAPVLGLHRPPWTAPG